MHAHTMKSPTHPAYILVCRQPANADGGDKDDTDDDNEEDFLHGEPHKLTSRI